MFKGTVVLGGPLILTLNTSALPASGGSREITFINFGNYTGSFDNITLLLPDTDRCARVDAQPRYNARSFSVVLNVDRRLCKKHHGISALGIIAIVICGSLLIAAVGVILLVVFLCPNIVKRKQRTRTRRHENFQLQ